MHYENIGFEVLQGKPGEELFKFLQMKKTAFVVMGAFGRNKLSTLLKHSTAELVIETINAPVFVAHH
jgi:nucleotide-binding universal stress UspA family protein